MITDSYSYKAFGDPLQTGSGTVNPHTFVGLERYRRQTNGFYLLGVRILDPFTGRFNSVDPIGFDAGDWNLYRYVGNEPVRRSDPFGLAPGCNPQTGQPFNVPPLSRYTACYKRVCAEFAEDSTFINSFYTWYCNSSGVLSKQTIGCLPDERLAGADLKGTEPCFQNIDPTPWCAYMGVGKDRAGIARPDGATGSPFYACANECWSKSLLLVSSLIRTCPRSILGGDRSLMQCGQGLDPIGPPTIVLPSWFLNCAGSLGNVVRGIL